MQRNVLLHLHVTCTEWYTTILVVHYLQPHSQAYDQGDKQCLTSATSTQDFWQCFNPLTIDDKCTRHATLAARYQLAQSVLKIGFALAKRQDRGRWVGSPRGAVHMAAALADQRRALVGSGWTISCLVNTNGPRNHSSRLVGAPFLNLQAAFSQLECSLVREP